MKHFKQKGKKYCGIYAIANLIQDENLLDYCGAYSDETGGTNFNRLQFMFEEQQYDLRLVPIHMALDEGTSATMDNYRLKIMTEILKQNNNHYVGFVFGFFGSVNHYISALYDGEKLLVMDSMKDNNYISTLEEIINFYRIVEIHGISDSSSGRKGEIITWHKNEIFNF